MFETKWYVDIMEYYEDEELWFVLFKLRLLANKDKRLKPKKAHEFKKSLENINKIKENARKLQDNDKYLEILLMADEIEETLKAEIKQKKLSSRWLKAISKYNLFNFHEIHLYSFMASIRHVYNGNNL